MPKYFEIYVFVYLISMVITGLSQNYYIKSGKLSDIEEHPLVSEKIKNIVFKLIIFAPILNTFFACLEIKYFLKKLFKKYFH